MVNVTGLVTATLVAPFVGLVETRVNEPLPYVVVPVVNALANGVTALPSMSLMPLTDTLYTVEAESAAAGTNVRVTPLLPSVTVPAIALPPDGVTVIELFETVVGSMLLLRTAVTSALSGTPVWALLGLIVVTVSAPVTTLFPVKNVDSKQEPCLPARLVYPHK
jgi:hypothetical protein